MLAFFYSDTADSKITIPSLVVSNLINWLLHGVLTVQLYLYYLAFPNDNAWTKAAVYMTYSLETAQVIGLGITMLLVIIISPSAALPAFFYSYWLFPDPIWAAQALLLDFVGGLVPFIVQCIYAHHIRIITGRKLMPGLIVTFAVLQFFAAIATTMSPASTVTTTAIIFMLWSALNVVNDFIIAFVMVRSLSKERPLSDHIRLRVVRLIHLIMATGSLTVAANSLSLICILSSVGGKAGMPMLVLMPKLYANSILVMLNDRMTIKHSQNATPNISANIISTLVIADHQTAPSDSVMSRDEERFSTAATRLPN